MHPKDPEPPELRTNSDERSRDLQMEVPVACNGDREQIPDILEPVNQVLQLY